MEYGLQFPEVSEEELKLRHPCGIIVAGPQQTGKSTFILRMVKEAKYLFNPPPKTQLYCYGEYDDRIHDYRNAGALVMSGLPDEATIDALEKPAVIYLDDLMLHAKDQYLQDLFTKKIHHKNISVVFLVQNAFDKNIRVARLNSQYMVFMRAPNMALQLRTIGSQMYPGMLHYFMDAANKAMHKPYTYLFGDNHPKTSDKLRLRTGIFPDDDKVVFLPK